MSGVVASNEMVRRYHMCGKGIIWSGGKRYNKHDKAKCDPANGIGILQNIVIGHIFQKDRMLYSILITWAHRCFSAEPNTYKLQLLKCTKNSPNGIKLDFQKMCGKVKPALVWYKPDNVWTETMCSKFVCICHWQYKICFVISTFGHSIICSNLISIDRLGQ